MLNQQKATDTNTVHLDITREICPMTFVRTRLALDRLAAGALLQVRLKGEEPRRNVPQSAIQQGHAILQVTDEPDGISVILIRKG